MSENSSASDWIYILLTLFAAGISLLKSGSSKKKQIRPTPVSREMVWEEEEQETEIPIEPEKNEYIVEEYTDDVFQGDYYKEKKKELLVCVEEKTEDKEDEAEFDARKAVIYSEIFNRKYN